MKPILPTPEVAEIYLENFKQFGSALMECGGEPFRILKNNDEFLRTLALNNISVTAKYDGPEFKKEPTHYVDPKTLVTKLKKQEDCAKEEYDAVSYEQHEAEAIEKECRAYEHLKKVTEVARLRDYKVFTKNDYNQKFYHIDKDIFSNEHFTFKEVKRFIDQGLFVILKYSDESKEKKEVKPKSLEYYPPEVSLGKDSPKYYLEIYDGKDWKLCMKMKCEFTVPKFGWSSDGHPLTLGKGKIANMHMVDMYTLSNLKKIVDGLNLLDNKDRSSVPSTTIETSKEKVNWQKDFPHSITTSP